MRARRALSLFKDVPLRTRRALSLLVLNVTSLNSDSALLALNWRHILYLIFLGLSSASSSLSSYHSTFLEKVILSHKIEWLSPNSSPPSFHSPLMFPVFHMAYNSIQAFLSLLLFLPSSLNIISFFFDITFNIACYSSSYTFLSFIPFFLHLYSLFPSSFILLLLFISFLLVLFLKSQSSSSYPNFSIFMYSQF